MGLPKFLQSVREKINLKIYSSKGIVINVLRLMRLLVSIGMVCLMVYFYGFPVSQQQQDIMLLFFRGSFIFFISSFLVRLFFDFDPGAFIRYNRIEAILLLVIFIDLISNLFFATPLFKILFSQIDADRAESLFTIFTQCYMLVIVALELGRASSKLYMLKLAPPTLFILSFVVLILGGAALLLLPEAHTGEKLSLTDAIFTSTSASCVTGLIVVDTASFFTLKGHIILMVLIQLGGLNIISFATFFASFNQKGVGLKHKLMIKDFMSYDTLADTSGMLKRVIGMTFFIELIAAIMIFFTWDSSIYFESLENKIFHSVFHSITAFNNAGFSTFSQNLYTPGIRNSYMMHIIIAGLVFLGGLGVPVMTDLFGVKSLRARMKYPWKKLTMTTRLSLYTSMILILVGAILFFVFESRNYLQYYQGNLMDQPILGQATTSFFHSVISRTAGFNTIDLGILTPSTILLFLVLMFIGASPGGTGGGIKTTTFAAIFLSAVSTIRGKKNVEIFRQTISGELLNKAFSIFVFSLSVIFIATLILTFTDPDIDPIQLAFEEVSAFSTTGLSAGVTSSISGAGKIVLIFSMLIGRVGVLTLAFALSRRTITNNYKYPNAYLMIG